MPYLWKARALKGQNKLVRAQTYAAASLLMDPSLQRKKIAKDHFPAVEPATYVPAQHHLPDVGRSLFDKVRQRPSFQAEHPWDTS